MSRETMEWLNTMTRIGDTDKRGNAWHYRMGATNHFPGAVPLDEVRKLLIPYEPTTAPLYMKYPDGTYHEVSNFVGMVPENDQTVSGLYAVNGGDYKVHPFKEWLLNNIFNLVDAPNDNEDNLHISSAGLLQKGAVAWVELAIDQNHTVEGFEYRPHLLASTSANGRYKTTYGRKIQAVVCDNTLDIADREKGQSISFKHSKDSVARIATVREATGLIVAQAAAFDEEVKRLTSWHVNSKTFSRWLNEMIPTKDKEGAALTRLENKREKMAGMWRTDPRIAPWAGTAFGVLQLSNTWQHHETGTNRTTIRPERNMINSISGKFAEWDQDALTALTKVSTLTTV